MFVVLHPMFVVFHAIRDEKLVIMNFEDFIFFHQFI